MKVTAALATSSTTDTQTEYKAIMQSELDRVTKKLADEWMTPGAQTAYEDLRDVMTALRDSAAIPEPSSFLPGYRDALRNEALRTLATLRSGRLTNAGYQVHTQISRELHRMLVEVQPTMQRGASA